MQMELWEDGPLFRYDDGAFKPSLDSVLLISFAKMALTNKKRRGIDIGCGSGIISIILALDIPELYMDGLEIQGKAVDLAVENVLLSNLPDRIRIIQGDLRQHRELFSSGCYDFSISNPPYYTPFSGKKASKHSIAEARSEESCTLDELCLASKYLTRFGGSFFVVYKPQRLSELFSALVKHAFEPKRIRFVHYNSTSAPSLVLVESRRGGNPGLYVEAPLLLKNNDGTVTEEISLLYKR